MSTTGPGLIIDILTGAAPIPGGDDESDTRLRWLFTADLYTHTAWGAATLVEPGPGTASLITRAGHLCRSTADTTLTGADLTVLRERWRSLSKAARRTAEQCSPIEASIRDALVDTADDAAEHLRGNDFSGMEAVTALFAAHTLRSPTGIDTVPQAVATALDVWRDRAHHYRGAAGRTGVDRQPPETTSEERRHAAHAVA